VGTALLAVSAVFAGITAVLLASCLRLTSAVGFLLAAYLLASTEVVMVALLLSPGGWLTRSAVLACMGALAVAATVPWLSLGRPRPPLTRISVCAARNALGDPVVAVLAVLVGLTYVYLLLFALTVPQSVNDTLLYHLPRAAFWKQQHGVGYVAGSPDERINVFPPNAEIELATSMIVSGGDRFVALVQLSSVAAAVLAIAGISRRLGFTRPQAAFGALVFASFTVVVLQAPTALNDLVVMCFLVLAAFFATGRSTREFGLGALALALAVGTKGTVVFALPALAAFVLTAQPPRRWLALGAFAVAGIGVGSYWYAVNLSRSGEAAGGTALDRGADPLLDRIGRSFGDLFELSNGDGDSILSFPIWSGLVFAACVAIVMLLGRRRWSGARGWIGLAAILIVLSASLVITWVRITYRAGLHALSALGVSTSSPSRLPAGYYESPMHSSYGLAFVILFVVSVALVVRNWRRGERAIPILAALAAVPITVLASTFLLAYDTMRMRYLVFGVALASASFGVTLRVRAVAWTATALACVSTAVLVAYSIPRPGGLNVLSSNRGLETASRWFVQGHSGNGDPDAFRFLEEEIPAEATLALALQLNTYVYPAWDEHLRRTVVFVPSDGTVPAEAGWLAVGPSQPVNGARLAEAGWRLRLRSAGGWRIFERVR
jgi:hypothetical protein